MTAVAESAPPDASRFMTKFMVRFATSVGVSPVAGSKNGDPLNTHFCGIGVTSPLLFGR